jgi:hypothetical protein
MTMLLEVTNKDTSRTLVVTQREHGSPTSAPPTEIAPGQSATFYVWSTHDLVLSEQDGEKK